MRYAMLATGMVLAVLTSANAAVLYDGTLGTVPGSQGWQYLSEDPNGPETAVQATQTPAGGATVLDTTPDMDDRAGYFSEIPLLGLFKHPSLGTLDRTGDGYTLRLMLQLISEFHASPDRAGFSVILLSSDMMGIEIGFWPDTVWAQNAAFTHGEEVAYLTDAVVTYDLAVQGSAYTLYADGSQILSGALRDYSGHSNPVYSETNFIFFGDNTTSAQGETAIFRAETFEQAIPEPATLTLLLAASTAALIRRRR